MKGIIRNIRIGVTVLVCIVIAGYACYESRNIIRGPVINISEPENGMTTRLPLVPVRGTAKNIASITLNDRPITINEDGFFEETVTVSPGLNIVKVAAKDKFGREKDVLVEIIRKEVNTGLVRK